MDWNTPFVIYRITGDGKLNAVYQAEDLKKAKYWLTYIAQPGDVLCKTPIHPKHSKQGNSPEYWSHKEMSGTPSANEADWQRFAKSKDCNPVFSEAANEEKPNVSGS